ncbi:MAG: ABC transporter permease [Vicingaceae bacterium]
MLSNVFRRPEKPKLYKELIFKEMVQLGIGSLGLIALISLFMGAVITLQTASNITSAFIPKYTVGFATRQSIILELSPTIIALILAGKVGSNIASEIGTMRVTEQIDALEIMGVNSASYLVLPKIIAAMFINPFLIIYSMCLGVIGGWVASVASGIVSSSQYIMGIQYDFDPFSITYAIIKTIVFAFLITSIPAYHGYHTKQGSLEVGRSSTKGVVYSSVAILISNYLLTQMLLI